MEAGRDRGPASIAIRTNDRIDCSASLSFGTKVLGTSAVELAKVAATPERDRRVASRANSFERSAIDRVAEDAVDWNSVRRDRESSAAGLAFVPFVGERKDARDTRISLPHLREVFPHPKAESPLSLSATFRCTALVLGYYRLD